MPEPDDVLARTFDFRGKVVADVGAGTGRSTFPLARHAARVIGIEPEQAMRRVALARLAAEHVDNVEFVDGTAQAMPLPDASVDAVVAVTSVFAAIVRPFVAEALRVLRRPGLVAVLDLAPGWYGGELRDVVGVRDDDLAGRDCVMREELGFSAFDFDSVQDFGTVANAVDTYGFIFGRNAIVHLRRTGKTAVRWRFRIHHLQVG